MSPKVNLLLDSGAYSAWSLGTSVNLQQYIAFCQANKDFIFRPVNLDVIPGRPGLQKTVKHVEHSAAQGWKNLLRMRKEGIEAIPVFHAGERFYWLDKMLDAGFDYIGVSGASVRAKPFAWLDKVWAHLCGHGGYPTVKTHGFMLTSGNVVARYPWFTVDSVSWLLEAAYGNVVIPRPLPEGGYDYTGSPYVLSVADPPKTVKQPMTKGKPVPSVVDGQYRRGKPGPHTLDGDQYDLLGPIEQRLVLAYLERCGVTLDEVRTSALARCVVGALYYVNCANQCPITPFHVKQEVGLLGDDAAPGKYGTTKPPAWSHPRMFLGTSATAKDHNLALTRAGVADRLISYYTFLGQTGPNADLRRLAETGASRAKKKSLKRVRLK